MPSRARMRARIISTSSGSAGASGQEAEGALVFDARALLVPVGRIELAQEIVDLVVAALDAVEPLEGGPGPARVVAPGHELTGPLERLRVVGLHVEQRAIGPQGHVVARHREAAPPDLAQHARIAWARAHEALPLPERGLARPRPVVELGQRQPRGHRVVAVARGRREDRLVLRDRVRALAEIHQDAARLRPVGAARRGPEAAAPPEPLAP